MTRDVKRKLIFDDNDEKVYVVISKGKTEIFDNESSARTALSLSPNAFYKIYPTMKEAKESLQSKPKKELSNTNCTIIKIHVGEARNKYLQFSCIKPGGKTKTASLMITEKISKNCIEFLAIYLILIITKGDLIIYTSKFTYSRLIDYLPEWRKDLWRSAPKEFVNILMRISELSRDRNIKYEMRDEVFCENASFYKVNDSTKDDTFLYNHINDAYKYFRSKNGETT